jgi:hypothetical protein
MRTVSPSAPQQRATAPAEEGDASRPVAAAVAANNPPQEEANSRLVAVTNGPLVPLAVVRERTGQTRNATEVTTMRSSFTMSLPGRVAATTLLLLWATIIAVPVSAQAQAQAQTRFPDPRSAVDALAAAAKSQDMNELIRILGPSASDLVSGDAVQDNRDMQNFCSLVAEKVTVEQSGDSRAQFVIGAIEWPFAIPVVKESDGWRFDTASGVDEILERRIGQNERNAIAFCRAYALAQWDYFTREDWDSYQIR